MKVRTIPFLLFLMICLSFTHCRQKNYSFIRKTSTKVRGGTIPLPKLEYNTAIPASWQALQEKGLSAYERDRRAILGLQGEYAVRFEFIEAYLLASDKELDVPYTSGATEYIFTVEDSKDLISLQHILVMNMPISPKPIVVKHWRQDWQWQAKKRFAYQGDKEWAVESVSKSASKGKWVWSVSQVDDSPRYSGIGSWQHFSSASIFTTDTMSRPLPRREYTVRNDYKLLMAQETLVLTPNTWYHEQKSFKHKNVLKDGGFNGSLLARELGHNTYRRIKGFDWSAGKNYWKQTKEYWQEVRLFWKQQKKTQKRVKLRAKVDGKRLFGRLFKQAKDEKVLSLSSNEKQKLIKETISKYLAK
ncbi:MAG: DUF6607 family protein [Spirochaetota bacterium]